MAFGVRLRYFVGLVEFCPTWPLVWFLLTDGFFVADAFFTSLLCTTAYIPCLRKIKGILCLVTYLNFFKMKSPRQIQHPTFFFRIPFCGLFISQIFCLFLFYSEFPDRLTHIVNYVDCYGANGSGLATYENMRFTLAKDAKNYKYEPINDLVNRLQLIHLPTSIRGWEI